MPDSDILTDDELELSEEERRRRAQPEAIGTPIEPSQFSTSESLTEPAQPKADSIGAPLQLQTPHAQRPAYQHYQELAGEQPKPWHDLGMGGKIGRVAESIGTAINPNIVAAIPGTEQHHQGDVRRARTAAEEENREIASRGEEELRGAQTEEQRALAKKNANPVAKHIPTVIAGPNGEPMAAGYDSATNQYINPDTQQPIPGAKKWEKAEPVKPAHVTYDQGIPVSVTDSKGITYDVNDPRLPAELKPLVDSATRAHKQHVTEDMSKQNRGFEQQEKMFKLREQALSAATKTMIEAAPTVDGLASRIDPLIDKLDTELGPGVGRWSEFWAGKVGANNPEYTKLRTDVGLLQTALMRMHVGARGGHEMMAHFKDLIDQGKQDPGNMRAALAEIRQYVSDLKTKGVAGGMSNDVLNPHGNAATPNAAPSGGFAKWKQSQKP